jgi:hypothetical protein
MIAELLTALEHARRRGPVQPFDRLTRKHASTLRVDALDVVRYLGDR